MLDKMNQALRVVKGRITREPLRNKQTVIAFKSLVTPIKTFHISMLTCDV